MKKLLFALTAFAALTTISLEAKIDKKIGEKVLTFLTEDTYEVDTDGTVKGL